MKFRIEIVIANSLLEVTKLFADQNNSGLWQTGFISRQQDNYDASKSVFLYKMNGRIIEANLEILENNLPEHYSVNCEMLGVSQKTKHKFIAHSDNQTKWIMETEILADSWIIKIIMICAPSLLRKGTDTYVQDFKKFAENMKNQPHLINDFG